jgi:hypothetical protein
MTAQGRLMTPNGFAQKLRTRTQMRKAGKQEKRFALFPAFLLSSFISS